MVGLRTGEKQSIHTVPISAVIRRLRVWEASLDNKLRSW